MIGAIADDVTGGTDVAVAFRRQGLRTILFFGVPDRAADLPDHDAVVIAVKTRMIAPDAAVAESMAAQDWLRSRGSTLTYFKYCSTFDSTPVGNIGPVLDALSESTGGGVVVTTPSSPEHGRTQYAGHLFVGDQLLSESHMRSHPVTPMTDSSLVRLLQAQTAQPIGVLHHREVSAGVDAIQARIHQAAEHDERYLLADALTDEDLKNLGRAVLDLPLVAGAAGLAGGIAAAMSERHTQTPEHGADASVAPGRTAVLSGSCSARTLEQVRHMQSAHRPAHFLDVVASPDARSLAAAALAWYDELDSPEAPLIYSTVDPERLRHIQDTLGVQRSAQLLEAAIGEIASGLVARGVRRIIAAGGETSGAVVDALAVTGGLIGDEAAHGVPWIHTTDGNLTLLLKSGNFGEPDLLTGASALSAATAGSGR